LADCLDGPGRLVAEQEREVVVDGALPIMQVGMAHTARLHPHQRLAGPGSGTRTAAISTGLPLATDTTPPTSCGVRPLSSFCVSCQQAGGGRSPPAAPGWFPRISG